MRTRSFLAAGASAALLAAASLLFAASNAGAQQGDGTRTAPITVHVFEPAKVAATPGRLAQREASPGFAVTIFAIGLENARVIAVAPDATVHVNRRDSGDVHEGGRLGTGTPVAEPSLPPPSGRSGAGKG